MKNLESSILPEVQIWNGSGFKKIKINSLQELQDCNYDLGVILNFGQIFKIDCLSIRKSLKIWRQKQSVDGDNFDRLKSESSFVRRDSVENLKSKTPHIFDSYFISTYETDELFQITSLLFQSMWKLDDILSSKFRGFSMDLKSNTDNLRFSPQIIHYPLGGGFFDWHTHSRIPQNYGLIFNLSIRGEGLDYESGSTLFNIKNRIVSIENFHQQGSLAFFKFDINHSVSEILPRRAALDWEYGGRFSAVLPLLK